MTNKRKARARELSEKTGMSYQAANNVITKNLPKTSSEEEKYIAFLKGGRGPFEGTADELLTRLGLVPEEVKKTAKAIGEKGLPPPPNNPDLDKPSEVELPPMPDYLDVFTDIGDAPYSDDYFTEENKRRRELRAEILLKLRDETRIEAFRKSKETGDMLQAEKERIVDMKHKILSDAMEAIKVLDERKKALENLVNPPPPPPPSGLDTN